MKKLIILVSFIILSAFSSSLLAQSVTVSNISGGVNADTIYTNQQVQFTIHLISGGAKYNGITNGFKIYSEDGAEWTSTVGDTLPIGWKSRFDLLFNINHFSADGAGADTVGFGGAIIFGPGLDAGFNEDAYTITIGPVDDIYHKKHICLDSAFYQPSGTWKWTPPDVFPSWDGPHCYTVIDPNAPPEPSNIILTPNSLEFTCVEGEGAPPIQSFEVQTDIDPFPFTLTENSSWMLPSPISGTANQEVTVTINPTGLTAGTYIDSIEVTSPTADNSPQWEIITLIVEPPAPTIAVTPNILFFNAVAGEANPDDKIISISNSKAGSADLEWTVSNSESWMSLSPGSGTNSGDVTVSIDITGLAYNDYVDTIIVSDPNATNDPIKIPVTLSVGSDLPLIAVDSSFNYIIIPGNEPIATIPPRDIYIYNGGAGGMTFSLSESSPRIFTLNPSSGTAPDSVSVGFKILGGSPGDDFIDTLWVNSPEAINSPFPVVFHFHYAFTPGQILTQDTVEVNVYECDQGAFAIAPPTGYFNINNIGGGESYTPIYEYESDLFYLEFETHSVPDLVSVIAYDKQLPLGTYLDTIRVSAVNAINSPQDIIVKYNVIPGTTTPRILLPKSNYILTTREHEGPIIQSILTVLNQFPGCMEWTINEDLPWLTPSSPGGNVPGSIYYIVNAVDPYTLGIHYDTAYIESPGASNSPQKVTFELRVWRLAGDFDWNGIIDISDLVYMTEFIFLDGAPPQPEIRVADMNCDGVEDISDMVLLVEFMFNNGPLPCGNPY